MSWGPNGNLDMWNNIEEHVDKNLAKLSYGPYNILVLSKDGEKWNWNEVDENGKTLTVCYQTFNTFMDAVNHFERLVIKS